MTFLHLSTTPVHYVLEILVEGSPADRQAFLSEGARYQVFLSKLQETTRTADGRQRRYLFSVMNSDGAILRGPEHVAYWTGHRYDLTPMDASEHSVQ